MNSLQINVHLRPPSTPLIQTTASYNPFFSSRIRVSRNPPSFCKLMILRTKTGVLRYGFGEDRRRRRSGLDMVVVRVNGGFGFSNGGDDGGGGGGWNKNNNGRILGNLALAVGLTYLSMTGQLGWLLDAIVSFWIFIIFLPIAGIGVFVWLAGREIVQGNCPNCGNEFQIFRSSLKDGPQPCPFCTQPFSMQDDIFVRESMKFSNDEPATSGNVFDGFTPWRSYERGKTSSTAGVIDVEAEVKDD